MRGIIGGVAAIAFLVAILKSRIEELGVFRTVPNFNNDRCKAIKGLESCEDIFVDQVTGLAYLACSELKQRAIWVPAMEIRNSEKLQGRSADYIAILDLKTYEYRKLSLKNLPSSLLKSGVFLHGLDLFIHSNDPKASPLDGKSSGLQHQPTSERKATLYFVNHLPPIDGSSEPGVADSVIEVFDTFIGSNEATYRTTIRHDLIITPNNLVAMSENSFYLSNDHGHKKHWTRSLDLLYAHSGRDSVVYCSFEKTVGCIAALHGRHQFPNGIAKGPDRLLYLVNTINARLRLLEIQSDDTLKIKEEIKLPRHVDNIFVTKSGSIFLACIPRMFKFASLFEDFHNDKLSLTSPSEVWKLSNETIIQSDKPNNFRIEKVLGDDGNKISGLTAVAVWDSKLFLTGIASAHVSICEIQPEIAI